MRPFVLLACSLVLSLGGPAQAAPEALRSGAVEKLRTPGRPSARRRDAKGERLAPKPARQQLLLPAHKTAVRGEIAQGLRTSRKSCVRSSSRSARRKRSTKRRRRSKRPPRPRSRWPRPPVMPATASCRRSRNLQIAITGKGRAALAAYKTDSAAHEALAARLAENAKAVTKLDESVARFRTRSRRDDRAHQQAASARLEDRDRRARDRRGRSAQRSTPSRWRPTRRLRCTRWCRVGSKSSCSRSARRSRPRRRKPATRTSSAAAPAHRQRCAERGTTRDRQQRPAERRRRDLVGNNGFQNIARKVNDFSTSSTVRRPRCAR